MSKSALSGRPRFRPPFRTGGDQGNNREENSLILSSVQYFGVFFNSELCKSGRVALFGLQDKQQLWERGILGG